MGELSPQTEQFNLLPRFTQPSVQHIAEVPPVFLAYNRVSVEGTWIPLIQVATAVVQSLNDDTVIDAVQPM